MSRKIDADVKVLRACVRALDKSSCERMLAANLEYLWSRYMDPRKTAERIASRKETP